MRVRGAARGALARGVLVALGLCLGSSTASASDPPRVPSRRAAPEQVPSRRTAPAQPPSEHAAPAQPPSEHAAPAQPPSHHAAPAQQDPSRQAAPAQGIAPQRAAIPRDENPARGKLIIAGVATASGFWTASAISAAALSLSKGQERAQATCTKVACFPAALRRTDAARSQSHAPLLIPLVGPWVQLGTTRPSAAGAVGLSVLGIGQAVGLGMLIGGLTMEKEVHLPGARVVQMGAAPLLRPDTVGLSIQGSM